MEWTNIWGGISGITILYALVMGLLCWFIIGIKGRWIIKTLIISISIWFAVTLAFTFNNFMGWPSEEQFKTKTSQIIWFQIKEPSKISRAEGAIYIWVREVNPPEIAENALSVKDLLNPMIWFVYPDQNTAPRSYKLPYTKKMHKKLREVAEGRGKGKVAFLKVEGQEISRKGKNKNKGDQEENDRISVEIIAPNILIPK